MIANQPYDTRGLKWVDPKQIVDGINRFIVTDYGYIKDKTLTKVKPFQGTHVDLNPIMLLGSTSAENDIPAFGHPLVNEKNRWIAVDLRQAVTKPDENGNVSIRNDAEYQLLIYRFVLSGIWTIGERSAVYGFKFPHLVFGDFISNTLQNKFGLHMGDQIRLKVLACAYYSSLFVDTFGEEDKDKLRIRLKKDIAFDGLIDEVLDAAGNFSNMDDFCDACYRVTGNIRLKGLDYNAMVSAFATSWFGLNSKEVILCALEHPPTWCALVYSSLTQRGFKNSAVAKFVDQRNKRDAGKEYLNELANQVRNYIED